MDSQGGVRNFEPVTQMYWLSCGLAGACVSIWHKDFNEIISC